MANRYSSRVEQARYNLDQLEANKPGDYESQYKSQIDGVQSKLNDMNKNGFSYDYTKDMASPAVPRTATPGARSWQRGRHGPGSGPQRRLRQQLGHQQRADRLPEHHERAGKRGGQPV